MTVSRPTIPPDMLAKWQRVVDLAARIADVPSSLVMKTDPPDHSVLVTSGTPGNPYPVGQSFELNNKLYCYAVLRDRGELVVRDASCDPDWSDNQDLEHGMSFYVGYPLAWPDGTLFGTICILDRRNNEFAVQYRQLLFEFAELIESDLALLEEMACRQRLEDELKKTLGELERRVVDRTRKLTEANTFLRDEINHRKEVESALVVRERELEDANSALRVLLLNLESSRQEFEQQVLRQIKGLVLPHVSKLRRTIGREEPNATHLGLVESGLQKITSAFANRLVSALDGLTPMEIEIAQMVLNGQTTKDIARALSRETSTIDFHRNNIRRKLGLRRRSVNLSSYLRSLS